MDELQAIDELHARHGPVFRRRPGVLYVAEPAMAKAVLANEDGRYHEHSDFFRTSKGTFGPREAQLVIGRATRELLSTHWATHPCDPERLGPVSEWPDAGNLLLYNSFRDVLVPEGELRVLVDQVVRHAVLAGRTQRRVPLATLRTRVRRALVGELSRRRALGTRPPRDFLDVLAAAAPEGSSYTALAELSEVYLSCVVAVAGQLGFLLGWSVYLLGTNPDADPTPANVVREALRLWPVTWNFARSPATDHQLGDVPVTTADEVVVCGYLVHRDARHWPDPDAFRPDRWVHEPQGASTAFIPFGWGEHSCAAGAFAVRVVEDVLRLLPPDRQVEAHEDRPRVAAALAPPAFTLRPRSGLDHRVV
ncbi:cytochrome P450 [Actinophytocola oryzae]|uniref:Cytochrome P450 n=1 Tax=Actinophytocola oryzae TaxID=502181 RepID=A0A4R7W002_9PSEU|nr:cytochrome P450 [Actinophytocola oryzae]TDV54847.1 cytochrome P450 [Actinophytocola oryzae]